MPASFDPYHRWLGIPSEKQPANHYALLAIEPFEDNPDVIESAADQRMAHLRNFQTGQHGTLSQKLLNEVAAAKICLLNPGKKAAYDRNLRAEIEAARPAVPKAVPMKPKPAAPAGRPAQVATEEPASVAEIARRRRSQLGPIVAGGAIAAVVIVGLVVWGINAGRQSPDDDTDVARQPGKNGTPDEQPGDTSPDPAVAQPDDTTPPDPPDETPPENVPPDENPPDGDPPTPPDDDPGQDQPPTTPPGDDTDPEQPPPEEVPQRQPLPSTADQEEVARQLDEIYKFAEAETSAEKLALAGQLAKLAGEAKETPAEQFVLLRKAMDLAAAGGDAALMLETVDAIAAGFKIDALSVKHKFLPQVAKAATDAEKIGLLAEGSLAVVDEAMAGHRYDVAYTVIEAAYRACQRTEGRDYRKQIYDRRNEVQKLHDVWQQFQEALATLKTSPDDAAANLTVGRWYCLTTGDWDRALPHLAKCSDDRIKTAAALELTSPTDAPQQIAAGDAWWTAAEQAAAEAKPALLHRAGRWYEQARPAVKSVLLKGKLDQRLGEIAEIERPATQVAAGTADRNRPPQVKPRPTSSGIAPGLAESAVVLFSFDRDTYEERGDKKYVKDLSNNQRVGEFGGQTKIVPGVAGEGIRFTDTEDRVHVRGEFPVGNAPRTLSAWFKLERPVEGFIVRSGGTREGTQRVTFDLRIRSKVWSLHLYNTEVPSRVSPDGNWHHHCMVFNGNVLSYLIDTVLVVQQPMLLQTRPGGMTFGPTPGLLDEVAMFDRALTVKEVQQLYQLGRGGHPLKRWKDPSAIENEPSSTQPPALPSLPPLPDTGTTDEPGLTDGQPLIPPTGRFTRPTKIHPWDSTNAEILRTLTGHTGTIRGIAFSPDGSTLISASADKTIRSWDVAKGQPRGMLPPFQQNKLRFVLSPKADWLAVTSGDHTIGLWDTAKGQLRATLDEHKEPVSAIAFSPDGSLLASGSEDATAILWDVAKGRPKWAAEGHEKKVSSLAFSPDGSTLASWAGSQPVRLWDVAAGELRRTLDARAQYAPAIAFSPDGLLLACVGNQGVALVKAETGERVYSLPAHQSYVESVAFSPDGSTLAYGVTKGTAKLWDVATGKLQRTLDENPTGVFAVAFSPDGSLFACGNKDGTITLWGTDPNKKPPKDQPGADPPVLPLKPDGKVSTPPATEPAIPKLAPSRRVGTVKRFDPVAAELLGTFPTDSERAVSLAFSPDGKTLIAGYKKHGVKFWDPQTRRLRGMMPPPKGEIRRLALSRDGSLLAVATSERVIGVWNTAAGQLRAQLVGHTDHIERVTFSPDGSLLASCGSDMTVKLWDMKTGRLLQTLQGHTGKVVGVGFGRGGSLLASVASHGALKLWDVPSGKLRRTLPWTGSSRALSLASSLDGSSLATGHDTYLLLWDPAAGTSRRTKKGHSTTVSCLAFHPDGSVLASSSREVRFWEVATGELLRTIDTDGSYVTSIAFSPDGSTIAIAGEKLPLQIWGHKSGQKRGHH